MGFFYNYFEIITEYLQNDLSDFQKNWTTFILLNRKEGNWGKRISRN